MLGSPLALTANRSSRHDFPTPESPIRSSCKKQFCEFLQGGGCFRCSQNTPTIRSQQGTLTSPWRTSQSAKLRHQQDKLLFQSERAVCSAFPPPNERVSRHMLWTRPTRALPRRTTASLPSRAPAHGWPQQLPRTDKHLHGAATHFEQIVIWPRTTGHKERVRRGAAV